MSSKVKKNNNVLLVGSTGFIGNVIKKFLIQEKYNLWTCDRTTQTSKKHKSFNLNDLLIFNNNINTLPAFNGIIWAQGQNMKDDIINFNLKKHFEIYNANVTSIISCLNNLINFSKVSNNSSIIIISSIWQELSKKNKLSYTISKSALKGLVNSLIADLSYQNIRVNAVLPGPIDTPMTHANLSKSELKKVISDSPYNKLANVDDVANTVLWLISAQSKGVTGNFIKLDEGASSVKTY